MEKLKTLMVSSVLGLGLISTVHAADNCIMVADLNVEFKNDSTVYMNADERKEIVEFADFLKEYDLYAVVEGHTSKFAPAAYNYDLSSKRATKVKNELIKLGVKPAQVDALGFGESSPLYDNNTESGAQKNRRVLAEVFNSKEELADYVASEKARIADTKFKEQ
jgi:outer membrane protein OmpA-like peptidoglycan-associated protein